MKRLAMGDIKTKLPELVNRVAFTKVRAILTKHDKDLVALVPIEDLNALREIEDIVDLQEIAAIKKEIAAKGLTSWEDIKKDQL